VSLLAIASDQPTSLLTDLPPSRAGSLLPLIVIQLPIPAIILIPVGASLLAKAPVHPQSPAPDLPLSWAGSLPQ